MPNGIAATRAAVSFLIFMARVIVVVFGVGR